VGKEAAKAEKPIREKYGNETIPWMPKKGKNRVCDKF